MNGARATLVVLVAGGVALVLGALPGRGPDASGSQAPGRTIGLELVGEVGGLATAVAADNDYAYISMGRRFLVLSYSASSAPRLVGETAPFAAEPRQIVLAGHIAYVVDPSLGIHAVDITDRQSPVVGHTVALPGDAMAMALAGQYAYVACGSAGMVVLDMSDAAHPTIAGSLATERFSRAIGVSGTYALVAERDSWISGLWLVDIADPRQPRDAGFLVTPGGADHVAISGTHAFVLGASGTLWVVDISDPAQPRRVGKAELESDQTTIPGYSAGGAYSYDLQIVGQYIYVAEGTRGLRILDDSYVSRPYVLVTVDTPGEARAVVVRGRRLLALVADAGGGMRVIDVEVARNAEELYAYDEGPGAVRDVAAGDGFLCVASFAGGPYSNFRTIADVGELASPARPPLAGNLDLPGYVSSVEAGEGGRSASVCAIAQSPANAYQRSINQARPPFQGGLQLVDAADRSAPRLMSSVDGQYLTSIAFGDEALYGTWYSSAQQPLANGLVVYDFRKLHEVKEVARVPLAGEALSVVSDGEYAFVAAGSAGLHVVSVLEKEHPRLLASLALVGRARSIDLSGAAVFVATETGGLVTIDVSDPGHPQELASRALLGGALKVAVNGDYAVVADGEAGVHLFDVSDPAHPRWLDRYAVPLEHVNFMSVTMWESYVYVGVDPATLLVLQLTEKPLPTPSTTPPTPRPTATEAPTVTPTPAGTETATPTGSPSPSATPGGAATGRPAYLPRLDREAGP